MTPSRPIIRTGWCGTGRCGGRRPRLGPHRVCHKLHLSLRRDPYRVHGGDRRDKGHRQSYSLRANHNPNSDRCQRAIGDAIFYTLIVMKQEHVAFSGKLLNAIVVHLWQMEMKGSGRAICVLWLGRSGLFVVLRSQAQVSGCISAAWRAERLILGVAGVSAFCLHSIQSFTQGPLSLPAFTLR